MTIIPKKGKVSLVSQSGVHQRRIFIFVLAAFHVIYSVVIIDLAKAKTKNKLQAHFAPNSKFNFHKYIKRSMEDDFKVVVGIRFALLPFRLSMLLILQHSIVDMLYHIPASKCLWMVYIYMVTICTASSKMIYVILIVGAKLEIIIMEMAREIQDKTAVVKGVPVVEPSNKYFWFNRPDIILFFIHFTLFQMKKAIFEEQTSTAIKKWQKSTKERRRLKNKAVADGSSNGFSVMSADHQSGTPSRGTSPLHLLHKFKHNSTDNDGGLSTCTSPRSCYFETELSEIEGAAPSSDYYELRRQKKS
ncbi:hypothetical protein POTOM_027131 [Populus tomentosa]|uniref:Uncharacterized protein n=1 Tax=Populus tomentosa TaxID=118781 RepID=A0A8X8CVM9_POPTO|nr:hypothetical protein POTOM_027131 [Populus tomentosa]